MKNHSSFKIVFWAIVVIFSTFNIFSRTLGSYVYENEALKYIDYFVVAIWPFVLYFWIAMFERAVEQQQNYIISGSKDAAETMLNASKFFSNDGHTLTIEQAVDCVNIMRVSADYIESLIEKKISNG